MGRGAGTPGTEQRCYNTLGAIRVVEGPDVLGPLVGGQPRLPLPKKERIFKKRNLAQAALQWDAKQEGQRDRLRGA